MQLCGILKELGKEITKITNVSWVPKKKMGNLILDGFTAPSGTSSIWKRNQKTKNWYLLAAINIKKNP